MMRAAGTISRRVIHLAFGHCHPKPCRTAVAATGSGRVLLVIVGESPGGSARASRAPRPRRPGRGSAGAARRPAGRLPAQRRARSRASPRPGFWPRPGPQPAAARHSLRQGLAAATDRPVLDALRLGQRHAAPVMGPGRLHPVRRPGQRGSRPPAVRVASYPAPVIRRARLPVGGAPWGRRRLPGRSALRVPPRHAATAPKARAVWRRASSAASSRLITKAPGWAAVQRCAITGLVNSHT